MPFGGLELVAVLAIALIIFGPKRLPEVGRTLGRGMRDLKGGLSEFQNVKDNVKDSVDDVKSSLKVDVNLKPDAKPKTDPKAQPVKAEAVNKDAPKAT